MNAIIDDAGLRAGMSPATRIALLAVCSRLNVDARQYGITLGLTSGDADEQEQPLW